MLFDSKSNSGWLVNGLKNLRRRNILQGIRTEDDVDVEDAQTRDRYSDIQAAADVKFLKSVKVNDENIQTIKEKIKLTSVYRKNMLNDLCMDLLENFPYFFTNPELVNTIYFYFLLYCCSYIYYHKFSFFLVLLDFVRLCRNSRTRYWQTT